MKHSQIYICIAMALSSWAAMAADQVVDDLVVSATRDSQSAFDLPVSIDKIDQTKIEDHVSANNNISEYLNAIPGVTANNRQNYAQDLAISIRGFGARANSGVRGIRLIADDIPASMPDGSGQVSNFNLSGADSIEVLRGPFSSLYGNASGGVIKINTAPAPMGIAADTSFSVGSFGYWKSEAEASYGTEDFGATLLASRFMTNGYRDHSSASRDLTNFKTNWDVNPDNKVTWVVNSIDMPYSLDPQGLTAAQAAANPKQASPNALLFDTRKSLSQSQTGVNWDSRIDQDNRFQINSYVGERSLQQFLSTPVAAQVSAKSSGGVINLDRNYFGLDGRWVHDQIIGGLPLKFSLGLNAGEVDEHRMGFNNYIGSTLGVQGTLRRDENNVAENFDQYAQVEFLPTDDLSFFGGLRHSAVRISSSDQFLSNGNDSGAVGYDNTSPVAGVVFHITPVLNWYFSYGKGFETPSLLETAYSPNGGGFNPNLLASTSQQFETGFKYRSNEFNASIAAFQANSQNELGIANNSGGRAVYQNVGDTLRQGIELELSKQFPMGFKGLLSATYLNATFQNSFLSCQSSTPCTTPNTFTSVSAGNSLPGIANQMLYGEVSWKSPDKAVETAFEYKYSSQVFANDQNSEAAAGYGIFNWRLSYRQKLENWQFIEFARVDNIANTSYIGSVIVNDVNKQYYEPSPGRNFIAGVTIKYLMM